MATLRPGYEIMYPKGVPHDDVKAAFSEAYGIPLERVVILEDGGGIYCSEEATDGAEDGQHNNDDVLGGTDSGGVCAANVAGDLQVMG